MTVSTLVSQPLAAGQRLSREEFLRRWEAMAELKNAELIGGVVYMPSPVSRSHRAHDMRVHDWLSRFADFPHGCEAGCNGTWLMLDDAPQPDADLCILPEYGGQSGDEGSYCAGAPELVAEVCRSSRDYDLGPKMELYQAAGVQEYLTVILGENQVLWRRLAGGRYVLLKPHADGVVRSAVFPGLWLDPEALLANKGARVQEVLDQGLKSPEHEEFVRGLAARKASQ